MRHARRVAILLTVLGLVTLTATAVSAGADKVTICHQPGTAAEKTLEVAAAAVEGHLGHGDTLGDCAGTGPIDACTVLNGTDLDSLYQTASTNSLLFPYATNLVTLQVWAPSEFAIYWEYGPEGGGTTRYTQDANRDMTNGGWVAGTYIKGLWPVGVPTYFEWGFTEFVSGNGPWSVFCEDQAI